MTVHQHLAGDLNGNAIERNVLIDDNVDGNHDFAAAAATETTGILVASSAPPKAVLPPELLPTPITGTIIRGNRMFDVKVGIWTLGIDKASTQISHNVFGSGVTTPISENGGALGIARDARASRAKRDGCPDREYVARGASGRPWPLLLLHASEPAEGPPPRAPFGRRGAGRVGADRTLALRPMQQSERRSPSIALRIRAYSGGSLRRCARAESIGRAAGPAGLAN